MRWVWIYLIGYAALVAGAGVALWRADVLTRIPFHWLAIVALVAAGFGVMLALTSASRPVAPTAHEPD